MKTKWPNYRIHHEGGALSSPIRCIKLLYFRKQQTNRYLNQINKYIKASLFRNDTNLNLFCFAQGLASHQQKNNTI